MAQQTQQRGVAVRQTWRFATVSMDTWVAIQVVTDQPREVVAPTAQRALAWFEAIEEACSRFEPDSEVSRLAATPPGTAVPASPVLLELTAFALDLARLTNGAFDPTVGFQLESRGFNKSYRTGETRHSALPTDHVTYRDVCVDRESGTIHCRKPLLLDLGALAKGLAIDLAARQMAAYAHIAIDAGGDVLVRGRTATGHPWRVGIQDPRDEDALVASVPLTHGSVCTSGDYERQTPDGQGHHIVDGRSGASPPTHASSVSVLAPTALAADGLSTVAMILGPELGLPLLEDQGVDGLMVLSDGHLATTAGGFGAHS